MADYWVSLGKKYCNVCGCWLSDNTSSIQFHESGRRHQDAVQRKLREIQKKSRKDDKDEKQLKKMMKRIEDAATAASQMDKESNPDMSLKIQKFVELAHAEAGGSSSDFEIASKSSKTKAPPPKILHREEKPSKSTLNSADPEAPASKPYISKLGGGWVAVPSKAESTLAAAKTSTNAIIDLELPKSKNHQPSPGSSGFGSGDQAPINPYTGSTIYTAGGSIEFKKFVKPEKRKYDFHEKTLEKGGSSSSSSSFIKIEPSVPGSEIEFKKPKKNFGKSNMRKRDEF